MLYNAMLQIKWLDYLECIILQTLFQLLHWNQSVIQRRQNPWKVSLKLNSEKRTNISSDIWINFFRKSVKIDYVTVWLILDKNVPILENRPISCSWSTFLLNPFPKSIKKVFFFWFLLSELSLKLLNHFSAIFWILEN